MRSSIAGEDFKGKSLPKSPKFCANVVNSLHVVAQLAVETGEWEESLHQHVGGVRGSVRAMALQVAQASPQRAGGRFPAAGSSCSTSAPRHQQTWPGRSQELERAVTRQQPVKCPWDVAVDDSREVTNSRVTERRGLEALPGMGAGARWGGCCSSRRVSGWCRATHGGQAGSGG